MRKIGKYTITRKLGSGGMGVVYAAHDPTENRPVALKVLADDEADRTDLRRFEREAWAAAQVKHPNTVAVLDAGQTVGQVVDRRGPLPWVTATKIIISACKGLAAVHAAGLVHRDVKPGNVMISVDGVVKLADFGLAKMANRTTRSLTGAGTVGTPHFMSPEQCHNEPVDGRTDIYALGATYYVLLTNATPFTGDHELQVMYAHCNEPVPDPRAVVPELPPGCAAVVRKSMAKAPTDRYPTAEAMLAALERVIQSNGADDDVTAEHTALSLPPQTIPEGGPVVPRGWLRDPRVTRRRVLLAIPAAGLIGVTAAVVWPRFWRKLEEIAKKPVPPAIIVPERTVARPVQALAVSDDGRWLAVGMHDEEAKTGGVALFDRSLGDAAPVWEKWDGELVQALAFSPDGERLAVGGTAPFRLVNTTDGEAVPLDRGDIRGSVRGVAFSPDGRYLAAAVDPGQDPREPVRPCSIRVWNAVKLKFLGHSPEVYKFVRDLNDPRPEPIGGLSFAHDGTTLAACRFLTNEANSPGVELWNASTGAVLKEGLKFAHGTSGPFAAFARTEPLLVIAWQNQYQFVRPTAYEIEVQPRPGLDQMATAVAISPDGGVAAIAYAGHVQLIWSPAAREPKPAHTFDTPERVPALAFADAGRTLVGGSNAKHVFEWRVPGA
jgi:hypothetical protein